MLISCCSLRQDWTPEFWSTSLHTDKTIPKKLLSVLCWRWANITLDELLLQTQFTSLTQPEYKNTSLWLVTEYTPICKSLNNLFYSSIPLLIVWMKYNTSLLLGDMLFGLLHIHCSISGTEFAFSVLCDRTTPGGSYSCILRRQSRLSANGKVGGLISSCSGLQAEVSLGKLLNRSWSQCILWSVNGCVTVR